LLNLNNWIVAKDIEMKESNYGEAKICQFKLNDYPEIKKQIIQNLTDEPVLLEYKNWFGMSIRYQIKNAPKNFEIYTRIKTSLIINNNAINDLN
jgi:hypothetical protein